MHGEFSGLIRPLTSEDSDQVIDTIVMSTLFSPDDVEMLASLIAAHHAGLGEGGQRWIVYAEDGHIAATAMYRPIEASDRAWDLTLIAVRVDRQGLGVGRRLMSHVEQELRAETQQTLVVQTSSLIGFGPARAFYHGLGYVERGRVPDYWGSGDDMVLFSKALTAPAAGRNP